MKLNFSLLSIAAAAALLAAPAVHAKPFKWASQGEISTWDIHSQNNALQNGLHANVYESLVYYNSKTFEVEPVLATSWKEISPTQIRFNLRSGVKFHDGSAFTADDAVYSLNRAMSKTSNFTPYVQGISKVVKVDASTVDVFLAAPNPVLLRQMTELRIMSKAWAEKNKSVEPKDMKASDENFAHRNAMGTGPYTLESWQPDVKMVFKRNPNWWGKMDGNVTEIVYTPIKSAATRIAALLSGEVDMVLDPTPQDLGRLRASADLKVVDGIENRTIFLAVTAMWSRIGVKAKLRTMPVATYFPMIQRYEASIYMLGWGVPTFDALYSLQSLVRTVGQCGDGNYNVGRYSNQRMDCLVDRIKAETDAPVRARMLTEALQLSNDTVSHIPLHDQVIPWAMKKNIELVHRADNRVDMRLVKVN